MIFEHSSKNRKILLLIFVIFLLAGLSVFFWVSSQDKKIEPVACTMEAKLCPDGSYVGRTGPNCEFPACPNNSVPAGYTSENYKVEEVLEEGCVKADDCETPARYLVQSRCPFTALCLESKCTVVCPGYENAE